MAREGLLVARAHRSADAERPGGSEPRGRTGSTGGPGPRTVVFAVAALAGFVGALGVMGSDALWLVPLGERLSHGELPHTIPYASARSSGWHDVPAGAELVFWSLYRIFDGARGLVVAQAVAAAVGFGLLARGVLREASAGATLLVATIVLIGALPLAAVVNVSLFSLALFPALLGLVEAETRRPSRRVWLCVPLLALWGNLHGEVLVGWGLVACYLMLERARSAPLVSAAVFALATLALFANPVGLETPHYYLSVFHSAAARQQAGLWAPLGSGGFDLVLLGAAGVMIAISLATRTRVHLWEGVALVVLATATVHVARTGSWFLFLAAYPTARALRLRNPRQPLLALSAVIVAAGTVALIVSGSPGLGSSSLALAQRAARSGEPVLAEVTLGQYVVLDGGRVWVGNPIDAFRAADQRLYVEWLTGKPSGAAAMSHAAYVLVAPWSAAGTRSARDPRLERLAASAGAVLYRVRSAR